MEKQALIISIDYTKEYCQACYFSERHRRPENITAGSDIMRFLIPTTMCYSASDSDWLIGHGALEYSEMTGVQVYDNFLENAVQGKTVELNDEVFDYTQLFAIYVSKIFELIQIATAVGNVENVTVNLRYVTKEIKTVIENVFSYLKIEPKNVRILGRSESFAYFALNQDRELWNKGVLLFDFNKEGFYVKRLEVVENKKEDFVYVTERNYSGEFSMEDLGSELYRSRLDEKLQTLYEELIGEGDVSAVYFTGEGFDDFWFEDTLTLISSTKRAFKGNNLYVKGSCIAGWVRAKSGMKEHKIICPGRTRSTISLEIKTMGNPVLFNLSKAPSAWWDACTESEFILDNTRNMNFYVTSLVSKERTQVVFDLKNFPERPNKTTRVGVKVEFLGDTLCEITVFDRGFGDLFPATDMKVTKRLNMEGFI